MHSNPHSPSPLKHRKNLKPFQTFLGATVASLVSLIMCIINIFILSWAVCGVVSLDVWIKFQADVHFHSVWGAVTVLLSLGGVMGDNLKAVCLSPMWTGIWSFPNYDSSCVWQIFKELSSFKWKGFKRNSLTAGRITLHVLFIDSWFHPPIHPKGVSEHLLCTSHVSGARDTVKHKCNIPTFIYFPLIDATEEWTNSCIT